MSNMSNQSAIIVKDIYKSFKLPHDQHSGLKQMIVGFANRKRGYETQSVLNDISFEIKKGEFYGIVGRNGSGKSTLLKILAGIYTPDKGSVQINGSLTPFIELGVGFNPELTGRENVFLNGALLGFGHKEMEAMYEDIVSFAELDRFMDQKLKNYSSGMQVRLAFSIAIQSQADILIFDEVLAVGDEKFQEKCFDFFAEIRKKSNKTIVLVTHDMNMVKKFCTRLLVLKDSRKIYEGGIDDGTNIYHALNNSDPHDNFDTYEPQYLKSVSLNHSSNTVKQGSAMEFSIRLKNTEGVGGIGLAIFKNQNEYCYGDNTFNHKKSVHSSNTFTIDHNILLPGKYFCKVGVFGKSDTNVLEFFENTLQFTIEGSSNIHGIIDLSGKWR